jgi:predicted phage terminase large subunit-like protein
MHTRWHMDDLAGRLLKRDGHKLKILNLPALATSINDPLGRKLDEPLWLGDAYGYGEGLKIIRDDLLAEGASLEWSSLYQQNPRAGDGTLFKTHKFDVIDAIPLGVTFARGWDLAATKDIGTRDAAYTCGVKMGRTPDNQIIVADVQRKRFDPEDVEQLIVNTAKLDGRSIRVGLPQDPGQAGKFQVKYLTTKLAGYVVESSPETGDKATRAGPYASQVNVGNVKLVRGPWNAAYIDELSSAPVGDTMDQSDASARAFSMIFRGGAALWAQLGRQP